MNDAVPNTVTIPDGTAESEAFTLPQENYISAIIYPAIDTDTTFGFKVSPDGTNWSTLYGDDGLAYTITIPAAPAGAVSVYSHVFYTWEHINITVTTNQTGDKDLTVLVRGY